ncbi:RNA-guided endonuclease InsQ/TnpB family protein [Cupriavidus pinatubonensis]|uniref:IS200/IS605 family transposase ISPa83 n=1 Tax=Cupriavidus pinatubonensis TaxID=248026 RepID=A0ABM8WX78_9BURK|nr:RNA-guided endonuclease TnpB family protein [Cupriavidus pinatubonensis]CAG9172147.1 IS200/IS605 family transposase ISPa83 [Cupriavidus pinatubonensis]
METVKTLKLRIKDKHAKAMLAMARDVNTVWNFCNETQYRSLKRYCNRPKVWLSGFDLQKLTAGFSKCEGVHVDSRTVQETCKEFATRLKQFKRQKLSWRVSDRKSPKYSLGWVPFKGEGIQYKAGRLRFNGLNIGLWDSYGLSKYELGAGSFNEDSRGRWYVNIAVKVQVEEKRVPHGSTTLGIDLGLKTTATYSDGTAFDMPKWYRQSEAMLGIAQRANKKRRVKAIHARIANQRKDAIHKETSALVKKHAAIFVGNVNAKAMAKTSMAKSVHDAAWTTFRTQLKYKAITQCVVFEEVSEAYSTQTCSCCGVIPPSSPKGRAGLGIRQWTCSDCGAEHDRDTNAARNIARLGLQALEVGIPGV